jgi:hypothetical protein
MNKILLQAENEALKARIKFLELKLSLQEQKPQKPKKREFIMIDALIMPQLRILANKLGQHTGKYWQRGKLEAVLTRDGGDYVAGFAGLSRAKKMEAMVKAVKELQSEGQLEDIEIYEKACK